MAEAIIGCFNAFATNYWCCDEANIDSCVHNGYIPCSESTFCEDLSLGISNTDQICYPLFDISFLEIGCTDATDCEEYNSSLICDSNNYCNHPTFYTQENDDSCSFPTALGGCTDPAAANYNPVATESDGSCYYGAEAAFGDSEYRIFQNFPNINSYGQFLYDRTESILESTGILTYNYLDDLTTIIKSIPGNVIANQLSSQDLVCDTNLDPTGCDYERYHWIPGDTTGKIAVCAGWCNENITTENEFIDYYNQTQYFTGCKVSKYDPDGLFVLDTIALQPQHTNSCKFDDSHGHNRIAVDGTLVDEDAGYSFNYKDRDYYLPYFYDASATVTTHLGYTSSNEGIGYKGYYGSELVLSNSHLANGINQDDPADLAAVNPFRIKNSNYTHNQNTLQDYRPLIKVTPSNDDTLTFQRYYNINSQEYLETSAPNTVQLGVEITDDVKGTFPILLPIDVSNEYMFCIARWDDDEITDKELYDELVSFKPWYRFNVEGYTLQDWKDGDLEFWKQNQDDNQYIWQYVQKDLVQQFLNHTYTTPGVKTIRGFVFNGESVGDPGKFGEYSGNKYKLWELVINIADEGILLGDIIVFEGEFKVDQDRADAGQGVKPYISLRNQSGGWENGVSFTDPGITSTDWTDLTNNGAGTGNTGEVGLRLEMTSGKMSYRTIVPAIYHWQTGGNVDPKIGTSYWKNLRVTIERSGEVIQTVYASSEGENRVVPHIWKSFKTKINLNYPIYEVDEFLQLGGSNFTYIPWRNPGQTPIISGINDTSLYKKSLESIIDGNNFSSADIFQKIQAIQAYENDELGEYIGLVDIEQTRVFKGARDMNELLLMNTDDYINDVYFPYNVSFYDTESDTGYWGNTTSENYYPDVGESCVGLIFINDSPTEELRDDCIIEFNYGDTTNGLSYDTSGQGNIGIHIGDFEVKKTNKKMPVRRDSTMNLPKVNQIERAI